MSWRDLIECDYDVVVREFARKCATTGDGGSLRRRKETTSLDDFLLTWREAGTISLESVINAIDVDSNAAEGKTIGKLWGAQIPKEFSIGLVIGNTGEGKTQIINSLREKHHPRMWQRERKNRKSSSAVDHDAGKAANPESSTNDGAPSVDEEIGYSNPYLPDCIENLYDMSTAVLSLPEVSMTRLGKVGFNDVPAWMRPFSLLSNGERSRVVLAMKFGSNMVYDDFASVVDKPYACSMATSLRRQVWGGKLKKVLIATSKPVILPFLQPDFVVFAKSGQVMLNPNNRKKPSLEWRLWGLGRFLRMPQSMIASQNAAPSDSASAVASSNGLDESAQDNDYGALEYYENLSRHQQEALLDMHKRTGRTYGWFGGEDCAVDILGDGKTKDIVEYKTLIQDLVNNQTEGIITGGLRNTSNSFEKDNKEDFQYIACASLADAVVQGAPVNDEPNNANTTGRSNITSNVNMGMTDVNDNINSWMDSDKDTPQEQGNVFKSKVNVDHHMPILYQRRLTCHVKMTPECEKAASVFEMEFKGTTTKIIVYPNLRHPIYQMVTTDEEQGQANTRKAESRSFELISGINLTMVPSISCELVNRVPDISQSFIGAIVGPSGTGKSTAINELGGETIVRITQKDADALIWHPRRAVISHFFRDEDIMRRDMNCYTGAKDCQQHMIPQHQDDDDDEQEDEALPGGIHEDDVLDELRVNPKILKRVLHLVCHVCCLPKSAALRPFDFLSSGEKSLATTALVLWKFDRNVGGDSVTVVDAFCSEKIVSTRLEILETEEKARQAKASSKYSREPTAGGAPSRTRFFQDHQAQNATNSMDNSSRGVDSSIGIDHCNHRNRGAYPAVLASLAANGTPRIEKPPEIFINVTAQEMLKNLNLNVFTGSNAMFQTNLNRNSGLDFSSVQPMLTRPALSHVPHQRQAEHMESLVRDTQSRFNLNIFSESAEPPKITINLLENMNAAIDGSQMNGMTGQTKQPNGTQQTTAGFADAITEDPATQSMIRRVENSVIILDEFTSHLDRKLACKLCKRLAKFLKTKASRPLGLIVAGIFNDVIPWLQPDWYLDTRKQVLNVLQPKNKIKRLQKLESLEDLRVSDLDMSDLGIQTSIRPPIPLRMSPKVAKSAPADRASSNASNASSSSIDVFKDDFGPSIGSTQPCRPEKVEGKMDSVVNTTDVDHSGGKAEQMTGIATYDNTPLNSTHNWMLKPTMKPPVTTQLYTKTTDPTFPKVPAPLPTVTDPIAERLLYEEGCLHEEDEIRDYLSKDPCPSSLHSIVSSDVVSIVKENRYDKSREPVEKSYASDVKNVVLRDPFVLARHFGATDALLERLLSATNSSGAFGTRSSTTLAEPFLPSERLFTEDDDEVAIVEQQSLGKIFEPPVLLLHLTALNNGGVQRAVWEKIFAKHHYLTGNLPNNGTSWIIRHGPFPIGFVSVCLQPGRGQGNITWRECRFVLIPEYQGHGIGPALTDILGQRFYEEQLRFIAVTAHFRLGNHRELSPFWRPSTGNMKNSKGSMNTEGKLILERMCGILKFAHLQLKIIHDVLTPSEQIQKRYPGFEYSLPILNEALAIQESDDSKNEVNLLPSEGATMTEPQMTDLYVSGSSSGMLNHKGKKITVYAGRLDLKGMPIDCGNSASDVSKSQLKEHVTHESLKKGMLAKEKAEASLKRDLAVKKSSSSTSTGKSAQSSIMDRAGSSTSAGQNTICGKDTGGASARREEIRHIILEDIKERSTLGRLPFNKLLASLRATNHSRTVDANDQNVTEEYAGFEFNELLLALKKMKTFVIRARQKLKKLDRLLYEAEIVWIKGQNSEDKMMLFKESPEEKSLNAATKKAEIASTKIELGSKKAVVVEAQLVSIRDSKSKENPKQSSDLSFKQKHLTCRDKNAAKKTADKLDFDKQGSNAATASLQGNRDKERVVSSKNKSPMKKRRDRSKSPDGHNKRRRIEEVKGPLKGTGPVSSFGASEKKPSSTATEKQAGVVAVSSSSKPASVSSKPAAPIGKSVTPERLTDRGTPYSDANLFSHFNAETSFYHEAGFKGLKNIPELNDLKTVSVQTKDEALRLEKDWILMLIGAFGSVEHTILNAELNAPDDNHNSIELDNENALQKALTEGYFGEAGSDRKGEASPTTRTPSKNPEREERRLQRELRRSEKRRVQREEALEMRIECSTEIWDIICKIAGRRKKSSGGSILIAMLVRGLKRIIRFQSSDQKARFTWRHQYMGRTLKMVNNGTDWRLVAGDGNDSYIREIKNVNYLENYSSLCNPKPDSSNGNALGSKAKINASNLLIFANVKEDQWEDDDENDDQEEDRDVENQRRSVGNLHDGRAPAANEVQDVEMKETDSKMENENMDDDEDMDEEDRDARDWWNKDGEAS